MPPASRHRAIDVLRGWAIVVMVATHVGGRSRVSALINLPVWLDPAGPFVLLSGLVLGMAARAGKSSAAVWARARQLWFIHMGGMVVVLVVHETTGRLRAPTIAESGGLIAVLWKIPTLRLQSLEYMNILPLFVVFFAVAPLLVAAMRRRATPICLAVSVGLWLVTQRDPTWLRFTDPACGEEAFVLPAWQLPFVLGLSSGFHAREIGAVYFPRMRAWLVPTMAALAGVVFVLAQLHRNIALRLGVRLPASPEWLFSKETWAPGRAVYTIACLGLGYLVIDGLLGRRRARAFAPLETLGRRSLYCFLVHLPLALLFSGFELQLRAIFLQDLVAIAALVVIHHMASHHVLGRYIPS